MLIAVVCSMFSFTDLLSTETLIVTKGQRESQGT